MLQKTFKKKSKPLIALLIKIYSNVVAKHSVFLRRFMVTKRPYKFSLRHYKISIFQSMAPLKYWYACSTKKLF